MPDTQLTPKRRLKRRQDFLQVQSKGEKFGTKHFLLSVIRGGLASQHTAKDNQDSRLGVTVTKKVDKRAARRNRIQRRIREIYRKYRGRFQEHGDLVVIARNGAAELDFKQTAKEVTYLLYKSELLRQRKVTK